jgi:hypothetical protein
MLPEVGTFAVGTFTNESTVKAFTVSVSSGDKVFKMIEDTPQ